MPHYAHQEFSSPAFSLTRSYHKLMALWALSVLAALLLGIALGGPIAAVCK